MRSILWKRILAFLLVVCTAASLAACGTVDPEKSTKGIVISEVVSSNGQSYRHDVYGSPDWIELHNESDHPIDLFGWGITDNIKVIKEGETLSLGEVSLQFFMVPMVHWPETMVTWCPEENTLFSGDAFGSFKAAPESVIDSESTVFDEYQDEMTRYYASIVGKYGGPVQAALKKLNGLEIKRICATHGPVWQNSIPEVVALYDRLSRYEAEHGVCLAYGSMYGNTKKAALELAEAIKSRGIPCAVHDLTEENYSFALRDVFKYDTVILGSPTYNNGIFPPVRQLMQAIADRMVKGRKFIAFGSFTWAAASVKLLNEMATAAGFESLSEGITFKQGYTKDKFDSEGLASLL